MKNEIIKYSLLVIAISSVMFLGHTYFLKGAPNPIFMYVYFALFSIAIYVSSVIIAKKDYTKTGFIFLGSILVKLAIFMFVFGTSLFEGLEMTLVIRMLFIGIIMIYLLLDVFAVLHILKKYDPNISKNT